ncbi:unnamed protein product [Pipistrellus nathusii]|uniref:Uncharacterized protein n=1 Tax=Pipistrellus nathusii TaxID=59473 RepID=A0ABN9ZKB4_PIPNA
MAKPPPPPERLRSRRAGCLSPRGRGARRGRRGPAGRRRGTCQLDPSCERLGCGAAGTPGRGDSPGAGERCLPGRLQPLPPSRAPPRPLLRGCHAGTGLLRGGETPLARRSAPEPPVSGIHAPRYITRDREEPEAASALPPLGPPRPRAHPAPGPAPRAPAVRGAAAGQPLSHGRGRSLQPASHLPSRRLTPPAVGCPGLRLPGPVVGSAPAILLLLLRASGPRGAPLATFMKRVILDGPACDQAPPKTALRAGGTEGPRPRGHGGAGGCVTGVGREPKRCLKPVLGGDLESQLALCIVGQKSLIFPGWNHHRSGCLQSLPNVARPPARRAGSGAGACWDL